MSNLRILRLSNVNTNLVTLSDDLSSFTFITPENLVNMGRCIVEVVSGVVQITNEGETDGTITGINRIVPTSVPMLIVRSNISQAGIDSYSGGEPNILGVCPLTNPAPAQTGDPDWAFTGAASSTSNCVSFASTSHTFLCERLPSQILIEKMYWSNAQYPVLTPANNYGAGAGQKILPLEIILKLTFLDLE